MTSLLVNGGSALLVVAVFFMISVETSSADEKQATLPTCASVQSVCNILLKNESDGSTDVSSYCSCPGDMACPASVGGDHAVIVIEGNWFLTCKRMGPLPVCKPGQASLKSRSGTDQLLDNVEAHCTCPTGYDLENAEMTTVNKEDAIYEIFCNGDPVNTAKTQQTKQPDDDGPGLAPEEEQMQTNKRNGRYRNLSGFYKRGRSSISGFYKRSAESPDALSKRALFYKRDLTISKRSAGNQSPNGDVSFTEDSPEFYEDDEQFVDMPEFDKKDPRLSSFYKRGLYHDMSAFYKRGREGLFSFYKRSPDDFNGLYATDDDNDATELELNDSAELSPEKKGLGVSSFYKRSLSSFYKRSPWYSDSNLRSFYRKRGTGSGTMAFYKRPSHLSSFYKRAPGLSSFYKRAPGLSSFYKRAPGLSSFYKRAPGLSSFYKRAPHLSSFYKKASDFNSFYKRGMYSDLSSFYKRGGDVNGGSFKFYKRSAENAPSESSIDHRPSSVETKDVQKRSAPISGTNSEESKHRRVARSVSSFYKRGFNDNTAFYKRGPARSTISNFYKRSNNFSNFYKRASNNLSAFYKRSPGLGRFYKRYYNDLNTFYKRSFNNLDSFYKRSPNNYNAFYKRSGEDITDLLTNLKENGENGPYSGDEMNDEDDYIAQTENDDDDVDDLYEDGDSEKLAGQNTMSLYKRGHQSAFY